MKTTMDLNSGLPKIPVCKISLSYDDRYYIRFHGRKQSRSQTLSFGPPEGVLRDSLERRQRVLRTPSQRPECI